MKFDPFNISKTPISPNELNLNNYLDTNGIELYHEILEKYTILFSRYNQKVLCVNKKGFIAEFLIPEKGVISKPLFTHELLHLNLRVNGIDNDQSLRNSIEKHSLFDVLNISEDNFSFIHNFLDHIIIFKDFKDMGYKDNEFVSDYNEDKFNNIIKRYLINEFENKKPSDYAVSFYIAKYIGLRSPVFNRNYSKSFKIMENLNPKLYQICKFFIDKYQLIASEEYNTIADQYNNIVDEFIFDLKHVLITQTARAK